MTWDPFGDFPLAREDGPRTAKIAARLVAPTVGTRQYQVLQALLDAKGAWVDGNTLATPECGGSEGRKRLRELRQLGWNVEQRPPSKGTGTWYYRIPA